MKATDLMIGDWVHVVVEWKPEVKYMQGEVSELLAEDGWLRVLQTYDPYEDNPVYCICDTQGIPLTPEILEKNGYTCKRSLDKEIRSYNWTSPDRRVTLNDQNGSPWFCIIRSKGMMEEVMIGINCVHELQHALRLCGIEKEIIL